MAMTYREHITYGAGTVIETVQYLLKNCYRLKALYQRGKEKASYLKGESGLLLSEEEGKKAFFDSLGKTADGILAELKDSGMSEKDYSSLTRVLKKRDYVVSTYFVDNGYVLSKEEIAVYESKITELDDIAKEAIRLNLAISKEADKAYSLFA
jgi:hypothetical protein